ncbi:glycosyltransferase family A protein [Leifsonia sp. Root112D2]|uniref:glycosyltransferase family A protein n=1 Tax=Leifsonia sp. Root112D2 TaxID=1736426 RepID=UPI0006FBF68A|nr:glycosyltransferase family A protein [Leifsonia sp. Root112D2]KQV06018.1 hypothetical protein ASC63_00505 [Leifsonia sp. Root112D2]
MPEPLVDHIIAVHDPARPLARAVGSVLNYTRSAVRVSVVCHNTDPGAITRNLGELVHDERMRLLTIEDGIPSPAGPFNAGLEAATAKFTSIMGSDDELQPGAIDSWLALQRRAEADVVIPRLAHARGTPVATPPTRPFRTQSLDGLRDRLSYRSAPLGLVSRERFGSLRMMGGLPSGEDVEYATAVWFSGARIAFDRRGPAYLIHDDAEDRVTFATRSIADDLEFMRRLLGGEVVRGLDARQRTALVVKLFRVHLFALVHNRPTVELWSVAERTALALGVQRCIDAAPAALTFLSQADRSLVDAMSNPHVPDRQLLAAAVRRRRFGRPSTLIPRTFGRLLAREAPLRMMAASMLVRVGR